MKNRMRNRIGISAALIGAILLTGFGLTDKAMDAAGLKKLSDSNDAYLQSSFNRSLQTFAVLTAVKTGLAVVEGSEVGLGFGIEVGNVVRAVYDYVDLAWKTVLAGMAVLTGTRYLLQLASLLDQWFLVALLMSVYMLLLCKWFFHDFAGLNRFFRGTAFFMTLITLGLYVVLPVSVAGGRCLSKKITEPSVAEAENGIHQFRNDLFPGDTPKKESLWSKLTETKDRLNRIVSYLTRKTNDLIEWMIKLIASTVFDCIVFPLGLFCFLYWMLKFFSRLLFDIRRSQSFREDAEAVLRKYFLKSAESNFR